jgi:hypothetical protein
MRSVTRAALLSLAATLGAPALAFAGMPSVSLSDVARLRVQTISFFLVALLLSAWLIQLLWNYLRKDFVALPRLTYGKAVGVVVLWGLLFVLVLTMISGARELMTPGAWEKNGLTYRLARDTAPAYPDDSLEAERRRQLERLARPCGSTPATTAGRSRRAPGRTCRPSAGWCPARRDSATTTSADNSPTTGRRPWPTSPAFTARAASCC